jgi:hypothetical protein
MSPKTLMVLAAAVAVLTLLAILGQRGGDGAATSRGEKLVPALQEALNDIERITLTTGGGDVAATLERRADGWVVADKAGYRADVAKIRAGIVALAEARVLEEKTANPESHARLGVEDVAGDSAAGLAIAIAAANRTLPTVILGNAEGSKFRYARLAGEPQSYLIDRDPELPRDAAEWVDATIVDVRGERIERVTITHPDGEVVAIAKPDRSAANFEVADVPAGRELSYPGVANVIGNALRELKLEDVASASAATAPDEETVVEYRTFDGLIVTVRGAEEGDMSWISIDATVDPQRAGVPGEQNADDDDAEASTDAPDDVAAEAQRIRQRTAGWRYRIAGYQYDQLTRRMADLLKPPA